MASISTGSDPSSPPNPRSDAREPDAGPSSHPVSSNTTALPPAMPMHLSLLPLLRCPVCHARLHAPTTLRCGHSVCAVHLRDSECPVPRCSHPDVPSHPIIPPASSVAYHPAPSSASTSAAFALPSRVDVTISKVLDLIARVQPHPADPSDSEDSSQLISPASSSSGSRRRPRSSDEYNRPRKRRRHRPPICDNDDAPDLLSHLTAASARQRSVRHDQPLLPPSTPSDSLEKELLVELTCEICFTLFYDPITTPCQHASGPHFFLYPTSHDRQQTFCTKCLHRALDHGATCPLCRQDLPGFLYFQEHPQNKVILSLLLKAFPALYRERGEAIEAEERDARLDTPIFVCQLSFPGMPTLLHFFEPRYRLMLRRCLESPNPCFGMVMPSKGGLSPHLDYGTMLEIRSVQMQPDGRSYVETWGTYRFRILEVGTLDGYMVGRIERIDDYPEDLTVPATITPAIIESRSSNSATQEATLAQDAAQEVTEAEATTVTPLADPAPPVTPPAPSRNASPTPPPIPLAPTNPSNSALMAQCRSFLDQLQRGTAPWIVQRLSSTYGSMPTDASSFSYWVASILPIDEHEKAKLLPIRSPRGISGSILPKSANRGRSRIYAIVAPLHLDLLHVFCMVSTVTRAVSNLDKARARVLTLPDQTDEPLNAPAAPGRHVQLAPEPDVLVVVEHVRDDTRAVCVSRVGVGSVAAHAVARGGVGELEGSERGEAGDCRCGLQEGGYGLEIGGRGAGLQEEAEDVVACWKRARRGGFVDFGEGGSWWGEEMDHFFCLVRGNSVRWLSRHFIRPADILR
ncbi:hypothetical protein C0993_004391 [Termitomyces sp. T159_Od127]|nr:hypothetical protein C0993_004391 [Termitomyces sp. T159_Od127]